MSKNKNMHTAKKEKNDEFYTQLADIEKECKHYREHFKDKVIFCNCDNPEWSNFWKFFYLNFSFFGLKKLIATHYKTDQPTYKLEYDGIEIKKTKLTQNGDFRSPESVELLKESDIMVTNPPFSLFREYVDQLMEYDKKFLIIGNINAITYKDIFSFIKKDKMWLGYKTGAFTFVVPDSFEKNNVFIGEDGRKYAKFGNISWFTNLDISKRYEKLILYKKYTPEEYPTYDNYDAINVNKVSDIPEDYNGVMGVPITFLDKYNPMQFEILGQSGVDIDIDKGRFYVAGNRKYARILIQRKE